MDIIIPELYQEYLSTLDNTSLGLALAKLKADCLSRIIVASKGDTRDALQANKYLLEFSPYPKKKEFISATATTVDQDLQRLSVYLDNFNKDDTPE